LREFDVVLGSSGLHVRLRLDERRTSLSDVAIGVLCEVDVGSQDQGYHAYDNCSLSRQPLSCIFVG